MFTENISENKTKKRKDSIQTKRPQFVDIFPACFLFIYVYIGVCFINVSLIKMGPNNALCFKMFMNIFPHL